MLTIFANTFHAATRFPEHLQRRPLKTWEVERLEAERRRRAMRDVGMR
jgi:hypothetical protein